MNQIADLFAGDEAVLITELEVDTSVDAALAGLLRGSVEAVEATGHAWQARAVARERLICAKEVGEHAGRGAAVGAVTGDVFGEGRSDEKRLPGVVFGGGGVAVGLTLLNGRDRAPGCIDVLGVPGGDACVGEGDVEFGEQADVGGSAVAFGTR